MNRLATAGALPERTRGCCEDLPEPLPGDQAAEIAATVRALSDPTRVQMIHMLKKSSQPLCICDFTAAFDLGQPTISHHMAKLRDAGFVESFKQGIWIFYRLSAQMPAPAKSAFALIP